jgi:serine/threonine protein kinase
MDLEILLSKSQKYEKIIDIFSLGIVLYQLSYNLNHPFNDNFLLKYAVNYKKDIFFFI